MTPRKQIKPLKKLIHEDPKKVGIQNHIHVKLLDEKTSPQANDDHETLLDRIMRELKKVFSR